MRKAQPGGVLLAWGSNDSNQLGVPGSATAMAPRRVQLPGAAANTQFASVAAGETHSVVVTTTGDVWTFGSSKYGLLARTDDASKPGKALVLKEPETPDEIPIQASAGDFHSAVLTSRGRVVTWGWPGSSWYGAGALGRAVAAGGADAEAAAPGVARVAGSLDIRLKQIASGQRHMLGLGYDGEVWAWGQGANGLMGDGRNVDRLEPMPVSFLLDIGVQIKQVACGAHFNLALSTDGVVFGWGRNNSGELGMGGGFSMDMESVPRSIDALKDPVAFIAAGHAHACAVTEAGEVFSWGMATWTEPHKMTLLQKERIVRAGYNYTAAVSDLGEVFTWGKDFRNRRSGVLGHGALTSDKLVKQPQRVDALKANNPVGPVAQVACGAKHVLAVVGSLP